MSLKQHKVRVGISIGDFNGIGPEIIMKALKDKTITDFFTPIIFGSGKLFTYQKNIFKLNHNFNYITETSQAQSDKINMVNLWKDNVNVDLGKPTEESTKMAIDSLEAATMALMNGEIDVLVTAPINKEEMMKNGFAHAGHTGYLEEKFGKKGDALMLMVNEFMRVAVVTGHIPVSQIASSLSTEKILDKIKSLNTSLKKDFGVMKPRIAVLGLNPHAGDEGVIGDEESTIISPAIKAALEKGIICVGPLPADGFFGSSNFQNYDGILAMYHDQGLIPFKALSMESGVNFTAGLNIVRTSPAHGTAYDKAGLNIASEVSFREALYAAYDIVNNRNRNK